MEKILKFILLLLICVNANAQSNFPKDRGIDYADKYP